MQNAEEKTVDIDTSGPGAEVELPEEQTSESNIEVSNDTENNTESNDSAEKSDEQSTVQADTTTDQETEENKVDEEKKKELEDYSEGVKRRIAKLTKKMREAERREAAALEYAKKSSNRARTS
jgi:hypothetical protein